MLILLNVLLLVAVHQHCFCNLWINDYLKRCWRSTLPVGNGVLWLITQMYVALCKLNSEMCCEENGQLWGRQDDCCWVKVRVGLEGPQACCMHGGCVLMHVSHGKAKVLCLDDRGRCPSPCPPALSLHLMSLYHCLDDQVNIMDLQERLFTRSLLLPDLSSSYVIKFMKFVILNWIQALEVLQRKSAVSNSAA